MDVIQAILFLLAFVFLAEMFIRMIPTRNTKGFITRIGEFVDKAFTYLPNRLK